jgi:hypothetical protein
MNERRLKQLIIGFFTGIFIFVIAWSLYVTGSPKINRELRTDQQRINDVFVTKNTIETFFALKKELPESLEALLKTPSQNYDDTLNKLDVSNFNNHLNKLRREVEEPFFDVTYQLKGSQTYSLSRNFFIPLRSAKTINISGKKAHIPNGDTLQGTIVLSLK